MKVNGLFLNSQRTVTIPPGGVAFKEGDAGQEMFGIIRGGIQLEASGAPIATLGTDDVFGEMAIVDGSPRMATATAIEETELAVIDRNRFLFLVHETPMFALSVMSAIADRLRKQN